MSWRTSGSGTALHALRVAVGDTAFFTALRTWTAQRRGGNGSVADLAAHPDPPTLTTWMSDRT